MYVGMLILACSGDLPIFKLGGSFVACVLDKEVLQSYLYFRKIDISVRIIVARNSQMKIWNLRSGSGFYSSRRLRYDSGFRSVIAHQSVYTYVCT